MPKVTQLTQRKAKTITQVFQLHLQGFLYSQVT